MGSVSGEELGPRFGLRIHLRAHQEGQENAEQVIWRHCGPASDLALVKQACHRVSNERDCQEDRSHEECGCNHCTLRISACARQAHQFAFTAEILLRVTLRERRSTSTRTHAKYTVFARRVAKLARPQPKVYMHLRVENMTAADTLSITAIATRLILQNLDHATA